MLNIFANATTLGQGVGATFIMEQEPSGTTIVDRRITPNEDLAVAEPVAQRQLDAVKIAQLVASGQGSKVTAMTKAIESESIRFASLSVLVRELATVEAYEESTGVTDEPIIAYVPTQLLNEILGGKYKFYINGRGETTYYSQQELSIWEVAVAYIQKYYTRLVFKDINGCRKNNSNTHVQAERVAIFNSMYSKMLESYKELRAQRSGVSHSVAVGAEGIF